MPVYIAGDGNNILSFRTVSVALSSSDKHLVELRARCTLEIALNHQWYDLRQDRYCVPFKDDPHIVCSDYGDLCKTVTTPVESVNVTSVLALSSVAYCPIHMFFPTTVIIFYRTTAHQTFVWMQH